jgi:hypothetical protein
MTRTMALLLLTLITLTSRGDESYAATFVCKEGSYWDTTIHDDMPNDKEYCRSAVIAGEIGTADVSAFKAFLRGEPFVRFVRIQSPGGSVDAAIEIGRLIRSRFLSVSTVELDTASGRAECMSIEYARESLRTELLPRDDRILGPLEESEAIRRDEERLRTINIDPARLRKFREDCKRRKDCRVEGRCCLSACVLILAGGIHWELGNAGLHRPSLKDLSPLAYEDVTAKLAKTQQRIRDYLSEMGVPNRVFEAMMQVPPDQVQLLDQVTASALFFGHRNDRGAWDEQLKRPGGRLAPSIYDWVIRGCSDAGRDRGLCISGALQKEFMRRAARPIP